MNKFFQNLQRRNVPKAAISYVVISWAIIQVAAIMFPTFSIGEGAMRILMVVLAIGFPIWVMFAYIFEWTPTGFRKTAEVIPEASEYKKTSRRLNHYIIAGMAVAIALLVADRLFNITGQPTYGDIEKSIAVLPFTNMSNDPDQDYFSIGLTDDILTQLAKIDEFRVISRTSTMQYAKDPPSIPVIGKALNVGLILEGSVQKAGNKLRITAQLINAQTDEHLWADSYDRPIDDLFSIQRELAISIAQITEATLSPEEQQGLNEKPTENMAAYEAYQKALYFIDKPHYEQEDWFLAIDYLDQAVTLDPDFAEAYSQLTICHSRVFFLKSDASESRKELAKLNMGKAVELDRPNRMVKMAQGYYNLWVKNDKIMALSYFEDVEGSAANEVELLTAMSRLYEANGDWQKYIDVCERAVIISPLDVGALADLGFGYLYIREWEAAYKINRRATSLAPEVPWLHLTKFFLLVSDVGVGEGSAKALGDVDRTHSFYLAAAYYQNLYEGKYETFLETLDRYPKGINNKSMYYPSELLRGTVYSIQGKDLEAKTSFEQAVDILNERIKEDVADERPYSAIGLAYAGLNTSDDAIAAAARAMEILPRSKNAFYGIQAVVDLAIIHTMLGRIDEAVMILEDVLSKPGHYHPKWLEQDPRFAPLKNHPKYQELIDMPLEQTYNIRTLSF